VGSIKEEDAKEDNVEGRSGGMGTEEDAREVTVEDGWGGEEDAKSVLRLSLLSLLQRAVLLAIVTGKFRS
jgi:hypothetical protein